MALTTVPASLSATALTLTTAAQPNITSVGTLTGLTVDDITINGSTISDAADLTLDVGGNITLDADGGYVKFSDGGTVIGQLRNVNSNLRIQSVVSDKDILFIGNDGGSDITALTLDMSLAGFATFNSGVTLETELYFNTSGTTAGYLYNDSLDFVVRNFTQDKDLIFKGNDGGSVITALTLDMSNGGMAHFNNGITLQDMGIYLNYTSYDNRQFGVDSYGLFLYNGADSRYDLVIDDDGKVGIGNNNPAQSLHVGSSSAGTTSNGIRIEQNEGAYDLRVDGGEFYLYDVDDTRIPFLIDTSGNIGINTTSPSQKLHVVGKIKSTDDLIIGGANPRIDYDGGSSGALRFFSVSANTERMRINSSGNLGIGTTSPSFTAVSGSTSQKGLHIQNIGNDTSAHLKLTGHNNTGTPGQATDFEIIHRGDALQTVFRHGGADVLTLDSSGRFKIGTGSYANSQYYAKDVVINAANEGGLTIANSANSHASYIMFADGVSSGTEQYAGYIEYNHNADRMRVKSNGTFQVYAVGLGADAFLVRTNGNISLHGPSNDDVGGTGAGIVFTANNQIRVGGNDGTNMYTGYQLMLDRMNTPGDGPQMVLSRNGFFKAAIGGLQGASGNSTSAEGHLAFYTATTSAFNERMRIDSSGNMTIKGSSNNGNLNFGGNATYYGSIGWDYQNSRLNFATNGAGDMQFLTGNATRIAVFRSNGCTAFGSGATATNASAAISIFGNNVNHPSDAAFYVDSGGSADWTQIIYMGAEYGLNIRAGSSHSYAIYVSDASNNTARFRVNGTGVIFSSNTTVQSISDRRLKENIVDANSQWNDIKALKWRNYSWKDNLHGEGTYLGLIADEVKSISPNLVDIDVQSKEDIEAGVEDPQYETVKYSIVWMKAMKALQEAMAKIETLEEKV